MNDNTKKRVLWGIIGFCVIFVVTLVAIISVTQSANRAIDNILDPGAHATSSMKAPSTRTPLPPKTEDDIAAEAAALETAAEVLSGYYDEDRIISATPTGTSCEVSVRYPNQAGDEAPDDWDAVSAAAQDAAEALHGSDLSDTYPNVTLQLADPDGKILLTIVNGKVMYNAYQASGSSYNPPTISLAEFEAIQMGMSYEDVCTIVGGGGKVQGESDVGLGAEYATKIYAWAGDASYSNAIVTFQGNEVISKSQVGLE